MSRCDYCEVVLSEGSRFCDRCGAPVASSSILNDVPEPPTFLAPEGWGQVRDAWLGLRVHFPGGWRVMQAKDGFTVTEQPGCPFGAFAFVLRGGGTARDLATAWVHARKQSDGSLRTSPTAVDTHERVVLRAATVMGGCPIEGVLDFSARGPVGLLKGWHAPTSHQAYYEPLLRTVLASVAPVPSIKRFAWVDPTEGSFRVTVAQGWSATGGVRRDGPYGVPQAWFEAWGDPSGLMRLRLFPEKYQFSEGLWDMTGSPRLAYRPAALLAREWLLPHWGRERPDLRLVRLEERPDLVGEQMEALRRECALRAMPHVSGDISIADGVVWYTQGGVALMERFALTATRVAAMGMALPWTLEVTALLRAPADAFARLEPILMGMALSQDTNPAWERGNRDRDNARTLAAQQDMWARQRQISQTLSETSDIVAGTYWSSQAIHDQHAAGRAPTGGGSDRSHEWSNAMLGWEDRVDDTGQVYSIPSGHERAWRDNQGNLIVGGPLTNPDPTWHELKPTRE